VSSGREACALSIPSGTAEHGTKGPDRGLRSANPTQTGARPPRLPHTSPMTFRIPRIMARSAAHRRL
jgi:hypothetical protein